MASLDEAPLHAHPLQPRYNPLSGTPHTGDYGMESIAVYGQLPCDLLICEMKGPSAIAIAKDGTTLFRDLSHLGRWIEVDSRTGLCLVGSNDYRTVRWLDRTGAQLHSWAIPAAASGDIYGLRVCGDRMIINLDQPDSYCETWIWDLDIDGYPFDAGVKFGGYEGPSHYARSLLIVDDLLWVASMAVPVNAEGCDGEIQAYDLTTEALVHSYYGHCPNDIDVLPNGDILWVDEHLDRIRTADPATGVVTTIMGGSKSRATYEPSDGSVLANNLRQTVRDGSGLSAVAVEYRGLKGLYAPNGCAVITEDLFAIADTDNSRIIVARRTDSWEPELVAIVALLNEPTKVRIIPAV